MKANPNHYLIIMAGGIGSRFYPFSRNHFPKQFQDILGTGKTLLQQTVERFEGIAENVFIVTNEQYYDLVKQQLPSLPDEQILLEPMMRNTAPCIAYASYKIAKKNPNANVVVSPADHIILDKVEFGQKIKEALDQTAESDKILTIGIKPTRPDTGYGYIKMKSNTAMPYKVDIFTEKPKLEKAMEFVESGEYLWNAGIFVWNVNTIMTAFEQLKPEMHALFEGMKDDFYTSNEKDKLREVYQVAEKISIDYAIMEKSNAVYVIPSDCGWSDLGTWKSLYELSTKDNEHNVINGNTLLYETQNCIIKTPDERLVIIQGLENYIVAEYDNVLVICQKDQEQRIKDFLDDARTKKGEHFI